jgi:exodeoxyribonuclease-3
MDITSWNVNSVRKRLERVLEWIEDREPDVLCLQEIKCVDEEFPRQPFLDRGYQVETFGQKSYNGVAILSRLPLSQVKREIPWPGNDQSRGICAAIQGIRVVNLYVPNGSELDSDKYRYKLEWLARLKDWLQARPEPTVICGDFNIAPADIDCYDPVRWKDQVLCSAPERAVFQSLLALGYEDSFRKLRANKQFTWWDYRGNMFSSNQGLRIDHHLLSKDLLPQLLEVSVDEIARSRDEASDHAPITLHLRDTLPRTQHIPAPLPPPPEEPPPSAGTQIRLFG